MKKIIFLTTILLIFSSCRKNNNSKKINIKNAVIYEVNIRQYSEQGTFEEFTKDIPMLKELGVKSSVVTGNIKEYDIKDTINKMSTGFLDKRVKGDVKQKIIRRGLEKYGDEILRKTSGFLMSERPKWILSDTLAISALELMEKHSITSLFIFSNPSLKKPDGIVHIHDILKSGIQ